MSPVSALLPLLAFVLILQSLRLRSTGRSWREAFVSVAVGLGAVTALATEGLSHLSLIGFPALAAYWVGVCTLGAGFLLFTLKHSPVHTSAPAETTAIPARLLLAGVAVFVVGTAVIAVVAPPNTWDAM